LILHWFLRDGLSRFRLRRQLRAIRSVPERSIVSLRLRDPRRDALPRTLVTFFGSSGADIEARLDGVLRAADKLGELPVFVTTEPCFDEFRRRGTYFEFFPAPFDRESVQDGRYPRYLKARYAHVLAKWDVSFEIELGTSLSAWGERAANEVISRLQSAPAQHKAWSLAREASDSIDHIGERTIGAH
jgi:hypothetical protein